VRHRTRETRGENENEREREKEKKKEENKRQGKKERGRKDASFPEPQRGILAYSLCAGCVPPTE